MVAAVDVAEGSITALTVRVAESGRSAPAPARAQTGWLTVLIGAQRAAARAHAGPARRRGPATRADHQSTPARTAPPAPPAAAPATVCPRHLVVPDRSVRSPRSAMSAPGGSRSGPGAAPRGSAWVKRRYTRPAGSAGDRYRTR